MPAQKRSSNHRQNNEEESSPQHRLRRKQSRGGGTAVDQQPTTSSSLTLPQSPSSQQQEQEQQQPQHLKEEEEQQEDQPAVCDQDPVEKTQQDDSDGSGTDPEEFDEIITVLRSELRNNVQCPICLGIIKKTRTVMGCLHRFCRECIDKSMRLGNNECPACRIHCASRRSLRDDQDFDGLIEAIYPDAEKYEEEVDLELVFCEEDKTRNEQIQASIAQVSRRQSEALNKKRKMGKEVDDCSLLQLPRSCYNSYSRRRKNQKLKVEESDGNEKDNDNDGNENPSPSGKPGTEIKYSTRKRQTRTQPSTTSASTSNSDGRSFGNPAVKISEDMCTQLKAARKPDTLTWGRSGARSHTCGGSRSTKGSPLSKLIDCLEGVTKAETEIDVHSMPTSLENGRNLSAEKPLLSSNPGLSVNQVLEEKPVSSETNLPTEEEEPLSAKNMIASKDPDINSETSMDVPKSSSPNVTRPNVGLEILDHKENLAGVSCPSRNEHLAGDIHA